MKNSRCKAVWERKGLQEVSLLDNPRAGLGYCSTEKWRWKDGLELVLGWWRRNLHASRG